MGGNNIKPVAIHRAELRQLYEEVNRQGGRAHVKERHNEYNRARTAHNRSKRQTPAPNPSDNKLYTLERKVRRKELSIEQEEKKDEYYEPIKTINTSSSKTFEYNTSKPNEVKVEGRAVKCSIHPTTKRRRSGHKKQRPAGQLDERIASMLSPPIIDECSSEITRIEFPNGTKNYVIKATADSKCPAIRALYEYVSGREGDKADELINSVPKGEIEFDDLGGGLFLPVGFGTMSGPIPKRRTSLRHQSVQQLSLFLGGAASIIGRICMKYFKSDVYNNNQSLLNINSHLAWPPLKSQDVHVVHDCRWQFFATQWAIRKYPEPWNKLDAHSKDEENLALHSDTWDVSTLNANLYRSGGGSDGKGGAVPGTDLMLFESTSGGKSVRVKTCMRDTVVLLLTNSNLQLHSGVKSADDFVKDPTAWSTRYIPFITKGAYWWAKKNPDGVPINDLSGCNCNLI